MIEKKKFHINWKRVLLFVLLFSILATFISAFMYYRTIMESKNEGFDEAIEFVLQHTDMIQVNDVNYFQEAEGYFILEATDQSENNYFIFLQDTQPFSTNSLFIVAQSELLSVKTLENEFQNECRNCELVQSKPAMIDHIPLWELTYYDESNRYVIEYKYLKNGQTYEKLRLTTK